MIAFGNIRRGLVAMSSILLCLAGYTTPARCQVPSFTISTIAGRPPAFGYTGDGGPATKATLNDPRGIVTDPSGVVYFCDRDNNVVRRVGLDGIITTIAGTGQPGYSGEGGPATAATLRIPEQAELDPFGNLFIADSGNNVIR